MPQEDQNRKPISLFYSYSYSHKDEKLRQALQEHLDPLIQSGMIAEWHDRKIEPGVEWEKEIDRYLSTADIILLLVSPSFVASEYCRSVEVRKALERHARGEARIIPVILRRCRWQLSPFAKLQATPKDARPVVEWPSWDTAFHDVVSKIEAVVDDLQKGVQKARGTMSDVKSKTESPGRNPESFEAVVALVAAHREAVLQAKLMTAVHLVHFEPGRIELRLAESAPDDLPRQLSRFLNDHTSRRWLVSVSRTGGAPTLAEQREAVDAAHMFTDFAVFRDIDAPWCPEMVALPAGDFFMGSLESERRGDSKEGPQHRVKIGYRFAIGRYPVTFADYDYFCTSTKREKPRDEGWGRGRRPVINVSWHDAQSYVAWLAEATGKSYRLPSEAEWEYGCRAGTTTRYGFGDEIIKTDANFCKNVGETTEVGTYPANAWGIHDMHGNVWEWVEDVWHDSYQGAPLDGLAWIGEDGKFSSNNRVLRGGSWASYPWYCRSAGRYWYRSTIRFYILGFRVARTLP